MHLLSCSYATWLRYEAGIKAPSNEYAIRGTALHTALEEQHRGSNFDLTKAVNIFSSEFRRLIDDEEVFIQWPKLKKMEADGVSYLERYYIDLKEGLFPAPTFVEEEFSLMFEEFEIVGKIDVIELNDTEIVVVDYKSGSKKPDPWMLRHNLQFTAYAWATLEKYGRLPDKLIWHHLKTGERLVTTRTMQDIDDLKQMVRNAINMNKQGIRHRIFHEAICDLCPYSGCRGKANSICDDRTIEPSFYGG